MMSRATIIDERPDVEESDVSQDVQDQAIEIQKRSNLKSLIFQKSIAVSLFKNLYR